MKSEINWNDVDWNQQDVALADQLGVTQTTVRYHRGQLGKPKPENYHRHRYTWLRRDTNYVNRRNFDWQNVDWTKQDAELSRELGPSREYVRIMRRKLGKQKPATFHRHVRTVVYERQLSANAQAFANRTLQEIIEMLEPKPAKAKKVSKTLISRLLNKLQIPWKRDYAVQFPWDQMNWDLPNAELEEIWKVSFNGVARHRSRKQLQAARWDIRFGQNKDVPELKAAIEAEKQKAQIYLQTNN